MSYKAYSHLIINCEFIKNNLILEVYNNSINFNEYFGPVFLPGRFCVIALNNKNNPLALYLLDNKNVPFQVYGNIDIFNEDYILIDETVTIKKFYDYAKQICIFCFANLAIVEIENNKNDLLKLENMIYKIILNNKFGWKKSKKLIHDFISSMNLQNELKIKILNSLKVAPLPKAAVDKTFKVNLFDYYKN